MATADELSGFVKEALTRGLSRGDIEKALLQAGWEAEKVKSALAAFAEVEFPLPVPRPRPYLSARDAFIYLVIFTTLYNSAYNLGVLAFQFINQALPDPAAQAEFSYYSRQAIRWSISSLVVSFPIFLYLSRMQAAAILREPAKRASKLRKWLTYMTLFIASGIIIGDLIYLLYNFLGGELTWRFLLKALTVGAIAGVIFGYYLWDLRGEEKEGKA